MMKEEKLAVSKANIEKTGQLEAATNTYESIREAFLKLDDARFYLNQVMGPSGTMTEGERKIYLANNLDAHDKLLQSNPQLPPNGGQYRALPPPNVKQSMAN